MTKKAKKINPKAQLEFKVLRLNNKLKELSDKIKRAPTQYKDHVKKDSKMESYQYKQSNIKNYLEELNLLLEDINVGLIPQSTLSIVPKTTLERKIEQSDFAETLFEGEYITAIKILNYPSEEIIFIALTPLSNFSS